MHRLFRFSYCDIAAITRQVIDFARIAVFCALFLLAAPAMATDYSENDTCTSLSTAKLELGDLTCSYNADTGTCPIDSYVTDTVSKYFSMTDVPCTGTDCTYCNEDSTNQVSFCYNTSYTGSGAFSCPSRKVYTLAPGGELIIGSTWFQAVSTASGVCVQVLTSDYSGWVTLGCKKNISNSLATPTNIPVLTACYVDGSCGSTTAAHSKSKISITSVVVECIEGTLSNLFFKGREECGNTLFDTFRQEMERIVSIALILYVIFYGIRVVLGERTPAAGEVFIFIVKMALVLYFSVGGGVEDFLYEHFIDIMTSLTKMMFDAGSISYDQSGHYFSRGLCNFSASNYEPGYELLALFDSIDCRVASYLFINPVTGEPQLLSMIIPAILTGRVIFAFFALVFGIYLLSITVYVVHNFIMSIIMLNLIMYFAPLFVPMALFSQTKRFYDNWVRSLLFGSLQPIVLFGFVTLMLTVFDQVFYADCTFTSVPVTYSGTKVSGGTVVPVNKTFYYFTLNRASASATCRASMGYSLSEIMNFYAMVDSIRQRGNDLVATVNNMDNIISVKKEFITTITLHNGNDFKSVGDIAKGMIILSLFAFLFYHFVEVVFSIAENLIGGPQNRQLVSTTPMGIVNKAGSLAKDGFYTAVGHFAKGKETDDKVGGTDRRKPTEGQTTEVFVADEGHRALMSDVTAEITGQGEGIKNRLGNSDERQAARDAKRQEKEDTKKTKDIMSKVGASYNDAHNRSDMVEGSFEKAGKTLTDEEKTALKPHMQAMMDINAAIRNKAVEANIEGAEERRSAAVERREEFTPPDDSHVKSTVALNREFAKGKVTLGSMQESKTLEKVGRSHAEVGDTDVPDRAHVRGMMALSKELGEGKVTLKSMEERSAERVLDKVGSSYEETGRAAPDKQHVKAMLAINDAVHKGRGALGDTEERAAAREEARQATQEAKKDDIFDKVTSSHLSEAVAGRPDGDNSLIERMSELTPIDKAHVQNMTAVNKEFADKVAEKGGNAEGLLHTASGAGAGNDESAARKAPPKPPRPDRATPPPKPPKPVQDSPAASRLDTVTFAPPVADGNVAGNPATAQPPAAQQRQQENARMLDEVDRALSVAEEGGRPTLPDLGRGAEVPASNAGVSNLSTSALGSAANDIGRAASNSTGFLEAVGNAASVAGHLLEFFITGSK